MQNIIYSFIVLLLLALFSCREKDEVMTISIKNDTPHLMEISLDEKVDAGYINQQTLPPGASSSIYGFSEVTRDPIALLRQAYSELTIDLQDEDSSRLNFSYSPLSLENYALNPYTDTTAWTLTIEEDILDRPVTIWNYEFIIQEELIER